MAPASPARANLWKGKGKATSSLDTDPDFIDLDPVITYRHLLSHNLGVRDPLRVIALCDSDAFYAACEMVRLGVDKDTPLVVLQWDALIAVNYPARKYGITRMIKLKEALKLCPQLKVVHVATYREGEKEPGYWEDVDTSTHKVSLDYYRRESAKIADRFKESLPGSVEIERASIDEAFFDYTKAVKEILVQRYPYLAQIPRDAPAGVDTPLPPPPLVKWNDLGLAYVVPPSGPSEKNKEMEEGKQEGADWIGVAVEGETGKTSAGAGDEEDVVTRDSSSNKGEDYATTWHDVALSIAAELMDKARAKVREMGYTSSAGISRNKFLAKLIASYRKPNSQSILRNNAIPFYLKPLPFQKIRFLGGKLGSALAKEYDASTVGDLLTISLEEIQHKFGENAIWVYEVLRGIDRAEVKEKSAVNKSMLASKNLPKPITNAAEGYHWIRVLAAELALRLSDARQASPNLWPKTIVLHARKGYEAGRSKQAPFPFVRELSVDVIANAGDKLWKELVGTNTRVNVSSVQLAFTGIDVAEQGQQSIEGFLKPTSEKKRSRDEISSATACSAGRSNHDVDVADGARAHEQIGEHQSSSHVLQWTCTRCGKTFTLPENLSSIDGNHEEILAGVRLEHEDFHFAEDLAKEFDEQASPTKPSKKAGFKPRRKKGQKELQGLEKYFTKK